MDFPNVECKTLIIPVDENYQKTVEAMAAEGWQTIPGTTPTAVFHLYRPLEPLSAPTGGVGIDESAITIIKAKGD